MKFFIKLFFSKQCVHFYLVFCFHDQCYSMYFIILCTKYVIFPKKKKKKEKFFIENEELNQSVLEKELFTSIKG